MNGESVSVEALCDLTKRIVGYVDVKTIQEANINELTRSFLNQVILGHFFPSEKIEDLKINREIVPQEYAAEEYSTQFPPVTNIGEIESNTMLRIDLDIVSERFSKIKVSGIGILYIEAKKKGKEIIWKVEEKGVWVTEVSEADPQKDEKERAEKLQEFLKKVIMELIKALLVALFTKVINV